MNGTWRTVAISDVATIERSSLQPDEIKDGTTSVGLENIETGGAFLDPKPVKAGALASSKFQFTDRHILYGKLRPYLAKIACPDFSGICSTDILPIRPSKEINRRYLFHFLRQPLMVNYANSRAVGVNLPRLSPSTLAEFKVPLPPIAQQRRIAEVLDRAEALRTMRRTVLA
jgi:type I restriction enzyme S subunit